MNAPLAKEQIQLLMSDTVSYRTPSVQGTQAATGARRRGFAALLGNALRAIVEFPRRQAVLSELSRLTDRELADIGLHRAELKQVFAARARG